MEIKNTETCFVCNEIMGHFKSELSTVTSYSEKPIYQLIETFTEYVLSEEVINDCGICQNCLIKFNEYDELIVKAEAIQFDIVRLMENKVLIIDDSKVNNSTKIEIEDDDDPIEYEPLNEMYFQEEEEGTNEVIEEQFEEEIIDPTDLQFQLEVVVDDTKENVTEVPRHIQPIKSSSVVKNGEGYLIVELENNQMVYQCDVCSKICKDKTKLKLHREIHTNLRNVICLQCGKGFKTMNCLRNHKRTHLPERVYFGCDQCDKKYTQKVQLKKHIEIVHMNRRDFKCETCNASFGTKSVLKMHMLSHSDYRSEECSVCGFRVHTKAKLRRHMKSHTGVRDYNCGICGKKFLYSYNVIAHVRNVHEKKRSFNQLESIHEYEYEQKGE